MEKQISKPQWIEDFRKMSNLFKAEENALIQSFLQEDYSLSKIYQTLLKNDTEKEQNNFKILEKQLKFYINEAFSYFLTNNAKRSNNYDFQNKIKKIEEFLHKIRKDFKNKFDELLQEEDSLEKELNNYSKNFENMFNQKEEEKINQNINNLNNSNIKIQNLTNKKNLNPKFELINNYINNILNNVGIIYNDTDEISLNDVLTTIKKLNSNDLEQIKETIEYINKIIEKNLGGINLFWQQKEHEEFLKLRINFHNKINNYEFLTALSNTIPYIPINEHKNHIRLFEKYSYLNEIKKDLLKKYKEIKNLMEEQNKKNVLEKIQLERENLKKKNLNNFDLENQQNKKKLIEEWKEKKRLENISNLKKQMEEEINQKEKEREIYLQNREKNQILIEQYRKKKYEEEQEKIEKEKLLELNKNDFNQIDFDRIKEREEILLEKRKNAIRAKSTKNLRNETNYMRFKMRNNSKLNKVESKLNDLTQGFKNKQRHKFNPNVDKGKDACTMANNVLGHTSKAMPLWRVGLNN